MSYENFEKLILKLEDISDRYSNLYNLGVDFMRYDEDKIISLLMEELFGEEGLDWIEWYLYERKSPSGEILKALDKEGREICHNIRSLWEEVNTA
jgi:hypothetical protein